MALLITGIALWLLLVMIFWDPQTGRTPEAPFLLSWMSLIWLYMTVVKRSRFRTIGYRLLGVKIITITGSRPSLFAMTLRLLMWICGPFNFVLDLIWLGADTEQQTLRDCYACTYVVFANAQPVGAGPVHLTRYFGAGLALSYPRVVRSATNTIVSDR